MSCALSHGELGISWPRSNRGRAIQARNRNHRGSRNSGVAFVGSRPATDARRCRVPCMVLRPLVRCRPVSRNTRHPAHASSRRRRAGHRDWTLSILRSLSGLLEHSHPTSAEPFPLRRLWQARHDGPCESHHARCGHIRSACDIRRGLGPAGARFRVGYLGGGNTFPCRLSTHCEGRGGRRMILTSNNTFESDRGAARRLRARNGLRARRCRKAAWPAAQLGR